MKDLEELEDYIEKKEDLQLRMMAEIVKEYGNEISQGEQGKKASPYKNKVSSLVLDL